MRKKQKKKNTKLQTLTYINIIGIIIGCAIYHLKKKKVLTWHLRKRKLEFSDLNASKKKTNNIFLHSLCNYIYFFLFYFSNEFNFKHSLLRTPITPNLFFFLNYASS